jgi:hypothetical protein
MTDISLGVQANYIQSFFVGIEQIIIKKNSAVPVSNGSLAATTVTRLRLPSRLPRHFFDENQPFSGMAAVVQSF